MARRVMTAIGTGPRLACGYPPAGAVRMLEQVRMLVGGSIGTSVKSAGGSGAQKSSKGAEPERLSEEEQSFSMTLLLLAAMLQAVMPLCMHVFSQADIDVSVTVLPSLTRLLQILKFQKVHVEALSRAVSNPALPWVGAGAVEGAVPYFQMIDYLPTVLGTVYHKMQHADDFGFNEDDDDVEVMEVSDFILPLTVVDDDDDDDDDDDECGLGGWHESVLGQPIQSSEGVAATEHITSAPVE